MNMTLESTAIKKPRPKAKPKPPPLYLVARKLKDPVTGQIVGAFVPASDADSHFLRERGFKNNERIRVVMSKPRNERFNRLVHGMGHIIVENLEGYENLRSHDAIKKLQVEARIYCETEQLEFDGMVIQRFIPKSLAFDSMDEHSFYDFWMQCCKYLIEKHWHNLDEDQLTEMIDLSAFH